MTTNPLDEIAARAESASEGPWVARTTGRSGGDHWYVCNDGQSIASIHASDGEDEEHREPDAEFIAHAREDVPALVAALRAVEAVHVRWDSEEFYNDIDGGSRSNIKWYCGTCVDSDERPHSWPCPTITAIREALGS